MLRYFKGKSKKTVKKKKKKCIIFKNKETPNSFNLNSQRNVKQAEKSEANNIFNNHRPARSQKLPFPVKSVTEQWKFPFSSWIIARLIANPWKWFYLRCDKCLFLLCRIFESAKQGKKAKIAETKRVLQRPENPSLKTKDKILLFVVQYRVANTFLEGTKRERPLKRPV